MRVNYQLGMKVRLKGDPSWGIGTIVECIDKIIGVRFKDGRLERYDKNRDQLVEISTDTVKKLKCPLSLLKRRLL